jgi:transcriptional regulator with XRE-family HTH domain
MSGQVGPEPSDFGLRLKAARVSRGETQEDCAVTLSNLSGQRVKQPQVSEWETGRSASPRSSSVRAAADQYLSETGSDTGEQPKSSRGRADYLFPQYVTGEPMLGDLQKQLIRDISYRLRMGPPMSRSDWLAYRTQLGILGLPTSGA